MYLFVIASCSEPTSIDNFITKKNEDFKNDNTSSNKSINTGKINSAVFKKESDGNQELSANSGTNVEGSKIVIKPGTLIIDTEIIIQNAESLVTPDFLKSIGIPSQRDLIDEAGPAVKFSAKNGFTTGKAFELSLPLYPDISENNYKKIYVIYKFDGRVRGENNEGIVSNFKLKIENDILTFSTYNFGTYQAIIDTTGSSSSDSDPSSDTGLPIEYDQATSAPSQQDLENFLEICENNSTNSESTTEKLKQPGETCSSTQRRLSIVTFADLSDVGIKDLSPLQFFPNLKTLSLSNNNIDDLTPLGELSDLVKLSLSSNRIQDLSPLKDLKNLEVLQVDNNEINSLTSIADIKSLIQLTVGNNRLDDLNGIQELESLTLLNISDNDLKNLNELNLLEKMEHIFAGGNQIQRIPDLKFKKNLTTLYLPGNQLSQMDSIKDGLSLNILDLSKNNISTLKLYSSNSKLEKLMICENRLKDIEELTILKNLIFLSVNNNEIKSITPLSSLPRLEAVHIKNNDISSLEELINLDRLLSFDASGNSIDSNRCPLDASSSLINDFCRSQNSGDEDD